MIASSARAARALRRLHAEAQRRQGLAAWQSPDILDWDSWLNRLWQKRLRSGSETRLLLTNLQEQQIWVRLVKPSIEGLRLISVPGVAELAQQAYGLLCAYGALNFLHGERSGDVESFRRWALAFERTCSEQEWLSRGKLPLVLHEAVLAGQVEATGKLVLTGFDRITPAQQDLIEAFRERGYEVAMTEAAEASPAQTNLLVEAVDKRDEITTCALWVQRELASAAAEGQTARIAVVVPGVSLVRPEIERAFRQILAPEAVAVGTHDLPLPYEFSLGVPLADVPMARSALLLLRWMNDALLQDQVSWLLLSGFICEELDELLPIAEFDVNLRRRAMRQPEQDLDTFLQSANPPDKLRRRLQAGRRLLLPEQVIEILPSGFMWSIKFWMRCIGLELMCCRAKTFRFRPGGRSCSIMWPHWRSMDAWPAMQSFSRYWNWQAEQTIFAPESRDAPVQILGPLEAAGLTFDALWFLGADDASWPAVARPHPFLPRSLQRTHNMPHADSTADWKLAQQVTARLERSAAKCVFSFSSQNAEGVCRPSTLVSSGKQRIEAKALRMSIGADESSAADEEFLGLLIEDEPAAVLPWPIEQDAGGAEILRRQAACPFQSFATRRLGARPMDATDWGLEPRERGSVVHKILESLWAELKTRDALLAARREARLPALVEQHVGQRCRNTGNVRRSTAGARPISMRNKSGSSPSSKSGWITKPGGRTLPSKRAKKSLRQRWEI